MVRKLKQSQVKPVRDDMLSKQGNRCAICTKKIADEDACLDHNHTTGFIRAVLCRNCNRAEGKIKTVATQAKRQFDVEWYIQRLLAYWDKHSEPQSDLMYPTHKTADDKRLLTNKRARLKRAAAKG